MKTLLLLAFLSSGVSFAQTNIIAAKSHASSNLINEYDRDNFGNPETSLPIRFLHSVEYLESDCIVEKSEVVGIEGFVFDTICEHPFLSPGQIDVKRLKAMYPDKTEFIGFNELEQNLKLEERELKKEERKQKKSSLSILFFFLGGGLFLSYLFLPNIRSARS